MIGVALDKLNFIDDETHILAVCSVWQSTLTGAEQTREGSSGMMQQHGDSSLYLYP